MICPIFICFFVKGTREFQDDTRVLCTTNYYRKKIKTSFKAKIRTSQGGESDWPLMFATQIKRAGCAREIYSAITSQGFSDHTFQCLRDSHDGHVTRALRPAARYPRWRMQEMATTREHPVPAHESDFMASVTLCLCVCFLPIHSGHQFVGRTSRGHTGGRSLRISHPPSF